METAGDWDRAAGDYQRTFRLGGNDYTEALLRFWRERGMLRPGCRVLDIGCGVGKYGALFARLGCDVTLTDISGEMLRHARKNMAPYATPWRTVQCDFAGDKDWEEKLSGGFDLSISTMSPAIRDRETVERMSRLTKGWCFLSRFARWRQPGRDRLYAALGLEPKPFMTGLEADCAALLRAVEAAGFRPETRRVPYDWHDKRTAEEEADYMLRRCLDSGFDRERVLRAAEGLLGPDGLFEDAVQTQVAWIWWKTEEKG